MPPRHRVRVKQRPPSNTETAMTTLQDHSIGIIGLGKMGAGIARHALRQGLHVVGVDKHPIAQDLVDAGLKAASDLATLVQALPAPRLVFLYVPAGPAVDQLLDQLTPLLATEDIVVDGGNSYWGDSIRRHERLIAQGVQFVDLGTSGGPHGAEAGACFMLGGDAQAVAVLEPLLKPLAVEGGYVHAGPAGTGHFVKLVHNGIEFGMLQAIGEGMALLEQFPRALPVSDILACWRHGSVIRSWLVDLMDEMYRSGHGLAQVPPLVEDTGEVNWLVDDAMQLGVPIPVITQSVVQLVASRDRAAIAPRAIAMMRHGFGGHPYGTDDGVRHERETGRVGGFYRPHKS
jgi:6-phosphogluconate dehydrogenase